MDKASASEDSDAAIDRLIDSCDEETVMNSAKPRIKKRKISSKAEKQLITIKRRSLPHHLRRYEPAPIDVDALPATDSDI